MTVQEQQDAMMEKLRRRFLINHFARHDTLELLLDAMRRGDDPVARAREAEAVLHKIAGAAGSLGLPELGQAAFMVEAFLRDHLAATPPDVDTICDGLDAFLDISLQVCNPTAYPPETDVPVRPDAGQTASAKAFSAA